MRKLVDPLYERVGYEPQENDEHLDIFLRTVAVAWACSLDNKECKEKTSTQFAEWTGKENPDSETQNP